MKTLADRIKSLRIPGETQAQFAERLGTTQASISRYVNGRQPDRETLIKISRRTNVTLDWLLTGAGPISPEGRKNTGGDRELLQVSLAHLGEIKSITGKERSQFLALIRELAEDRETRKAFISSWEARKKNSE